MVPNKSFCNSFINILYSELIKTLIFMLILLNFDVISWKKVSEFKGIYKENESYIDNNCNFYEGSISIFQMNLFFSKILSYFCVRIKFYLFLQDQSQRWLNK